MHENYFKIAIRSFWKNRNANLVNQVGLTIGLTCVMLIFSFIKFELTYDRSYNYSKSDYRVILNTKDNSTIYVPLSLGVTLKEEFPEIEAYSNCQIGVQTFIQKSGSVQIPIIISDGNFFKIFDFKFIYGSPSSAFKKHNSLVITETIAKNYFPGKNPIGEIIEDQSGVSPVLIEITGVIEDIPLNCHIRANGISNGLITDPIIPIDWNNYGSRPEYIRFKDGTNIKNFESKLNEFYKRTNAPEGLKLTFQSVRDIHLNSKIPDDQFKGGNISIVYLFLFIAFSILTIVCINYINLSTARSIQRTSEVSIRKTLGASEQQLTIQFLLESIFVFFSVLPLTILASIYLWPIFTNKLGYSIPASFLVNWGNLGALFLISLGSGLISSIYPAIVFSTLSPRYAINYFLKNGSLNMYIRKSLLIFQFTVSSFLVVSTVIAYDQMHLLNTIDLGFNKDNLIVLGIQRYDKGESFLTELRQNKNIRDLAVANFNLSDHYSGSTSVKNNNDNSDFLNIAFIDADVAFANTLQIPIISGRSFSKKIASDLIDLDSLYKRNEEKMSETSPSSLYDSRPIIVSDEIIQRLNIKEPIGHVLKINDARQGTIIGVIKGIKGLTLHNENPPVILRVVNNHHYYGYLYIRLDSERLNESIDFIEDKWKSYFSGIPFSFSFADERIQKLYDSDRRQAWLFSFFSFFSILIACIGLISFVTLSLQHRAREIGIRKVMGATIADLVLLISRDFFILIVISILIAIPIEYLIMEKWLQEFAYRIHISFAIVLAGGIFVCLIGLATVGVQAIKAALANPIDAIKSS